MTKKDDDSEPKDRAAAMREARLARALRANLARRKAQARARRENARAGDRNKRSDQGKS